MKEITLPQGTIRYRDEGKGPVLLFVHGLLVAGDIWDGALAELSTKYRCIAPDWPLGSHSVPMNADADLTPDGIARIVASFMEALDLRDVTIVANDSGGACTQLLLARYDQHDKRITRAVLTPCDAFEVFPPKLFWYLGVLTAIPGALALLGKMMHAFPLLGRLPIAYGLTKRPLGLDRIKRWIGPAASSAGVRRDLVKFIRGIHPRVTLKVAKELPRVTIPVLLAWAPEEKWFPRSLAERLADTLPNAEIVDISDSRVFVMLEQPRALADEIRSFLRRTDREREDVRIRESA